MQTGRRILNWATDLNLFRLLTLIVFTLYHIASSFNVETIPRLVLMVWGGLLILYELFYAQRFRQAKYWWLLALLSVSYGVTILLNFRSQPVFLINNAYYFAQSVLLFYPYELTEAPERAQRWQLRLNRAFIALIFVASLVSLGQYLFQIAYWIGDGAPGHWIRQGFLQDQLFGVYSNPNQGGMFALLTLFLSAQNNLFLGRAWWQFSAFGWLNLLVELSYMILSGSRGTVLTAFVSLVAMFVLYVWQRLLGQFSWRELGRYFVLGLALIFVSTSLYGGAKRVLSYGPGIVAAVTGERTEDTLEAAGLGEIQATQLRQVEEGQEISSGRFTLWRAGLSAWRQKPLFGVADTNFYRQRKANETSTAIDMQQLTAFERNEFRRTKGYMHNNYVTVLTRTGAVGFALYMAFLIAYMLHHLRFILRREFDWRDPRQQLYFLIFVMLGCILFSDLVESHLLFTNRDVVNVLFWANAGFLGYLRHQLDLGTVKGDSHEN